MINGLEYAWEDIQVTPEGFTEPLEGVLEINYEKSKDHTNIYARGADPVRGGRGKNEYTANIVVLQSTLDEWHDKLPPGKDITDLKGFGITVSYAPEGGKESTDQLEFVRAKKFKKGMKTGDGNMTIDIELLPGKIRYKI